MRSVPAKLAAVALSVVALTAACGSDGESTEAGAASPIAEFLGQEDFFNNDEDSQARLAERERARQEDIAACMKEQGFDYTPVDNSAFLSVTGEDDLDYDSREYAEKYGFGITTQAFSQEEVGPDLVGHNFNDFGDGEEFSDPNQEMIEAMDDTTRDAYYEALYGAEDDFPVFDPETMTEEEMAELEEEFVYEPSGCEGEAYADEFNNDFYQEFSEELEELYESVEKDPRVAEQQEQLTACIADKGFEFNATSDGFNQIIEELDVQMEEVNALVGFPGDDLTEADFEAMSAEELEAMEELFNQPVELPEEAKAILADAQAKEVEMALAVYDCGGREDSELTRIYQEVQAEYEQRFLDDNADRLAAYAADQ